MKLIHTADLHLDSKLETNLDKTRAKERRGELLNSFRRLVAYAKKEEVKGILIAGDLFDTEIVSVEARKVVYEEILYHPEIDFFYLRGNHDRVGFFQKFEAIPKNLKTFETVVTQYHYPLNATKNLVVTGVELTAENSLTFYEELLLREEDFNIVTLHGELSEYQKKGKAEVIDQKRLTYKNIDYLALGHIHEPKTGKLPPRGMYAYSGCLEGRGFDEPGEHGFFVLDIEEESGAYTTEFVPFAERKVYELRIEVDGEEPFHGMIKKIREVAEKEKISTKDMVKVILCGEVDVSEEKCIDQLIHSIKEDFYVVKVYDLTKIKINYGSYRMDATLKGEFVRLIEESEEKEKEKIIRCGLRALQGEEFDL